MCLCHFIEGARLYVCHQDVGAFFHESLHRCAPNSGTPSGNDRNFPGQSVHDSPPGMPDSIRCQRTRDAGKSFAHAFTPKKPISRAADLSECIIAKSLVAREAGLSTSQFIRSFRESTVKTPYQFLLDRRVQRAQTLMRDPRASLAKIAISSGFADLHHLARAFRRTIGVTPSAYRGPI
jgi:AraC-like DNA-binding protein